MPAANCSRKTCAPSSSPRLGRGVVRRASGSSRRRVLREQRPEHRERDERASATRGRASPPRGLATVPASVSVIDAAPIRKNCAPPAIRKTFCISVPAASGRARLRTRDRCPAPAAGRAWWEGDRRRQPGRRDHAGDQRERDEVGGVEPSGEASGCGRGHAWRSSAWADDRSGAPPPFAPTTIAMPPQPSDQFALGFPPPAVALAGVCASRARRTPASRSSGRRARGSAVTLDARRRLRPRDPTVTRRDLASLLRRLELSYCGLDLWIPPEHFADAARRQGREPRRAQAIAQRRGVA